MGSRAVSSRRGGEEGGWPGEGVGRAGEVAVIAGCWVAARDGEPLPALLLARALLLLLLLLLPGVLPGGCWRCCLRWARRWSQ